MTTSAARLLADPLPGGHLVYPYNDEQQMAEAVSIFAAAGIGMDETVVLITTQSHRNAIQERLTDGGISVDHLTATGQLTFLDAEELLPELLVNGMPEPSVFHTTVSHMIETARACSCSGQVRIFGEIVSLMWKRQLAAAILLEELWNEVLQTNSLRLLCTYALDARGPFAHKMFPERLLALHSHTIK